MADLTTLPKVKEWLGLAPMNTTSDALLGRLITSASDYIQTWLDRTVTAGTYTENRDGNGALRMKFRNYPCTAVSSLTIDRLPIPMSVNGSPGYMFDSNSLVLVGGVYRFTQGMMNVSISYSAGYASVPNEIEQACIELVSLRFKERDRIGITSKGMSGESISFSQRDMSDAIESTLNQYKRVVPI